MILKYPLSLYITQVSTFLTPSYLPSPIHLLVILLTFTEEFKDLLTFCLFNFYHFYGYQNSHK